MKDLSIYKNKKVLCAMSGGIDSTMSAILLKEAGCSVIGMTMKTWDYASSGGSNKTTGCCSLDDINDAREICVDMGIPHYVIDIRESFNDSVMNNFIDEYMHARTPNPCILCNTHIKWGALLEKARMLGCEFIATGHYANIKLENGRYFISKGLDESKDQSYVLWGLPQEVLAKTIFPVGDILKSDLRQLAEDKGYTNLSKKSESYEICFIPDNDYRGFLSRKREIKGGNFIDKDGNILGTHDGIPFFTIGQRKGLGVVFGEPMYVVSINAKTNDITLGREEDLEKKSMIVKKVNLQKFGAFEDGMEILANVRYRGSKSHARLYSLDNETVIVEFFHGVKAITPGQSSVFYDANNPSDVIGGGHIFEVLN